MGRVGPVGRAGLVGGVGPVRVVGPVGRVGPVEGGSRGGVGRVGGAGPEEGGSSRWDRVEEHEKGGVVDGSAGGVCEE